MNYVQPQKLDEALGLLATESWSILAGGTDFYPAMLESAPASHVLDLHALDELRGITRTHDEIRIGAGATWSDVIQAELPCAFDALKLAARELGSVQIQNRATVVGNLCNASPAADGVPPLLVLDAKVELLSIAAGRRLIPLQEFILGNRLTARQPDEMVSAVVIPVSSASGQSSFLKLGARKYLIISISMVAARVTIDEHGVITQIAVSVGSCSLVACRLKALEDALTGLPIAGDLAGIVRPSHLDCLAPIDDVRSNRQYRMDASLELIKRVLGKIAREPR